MMKKEDKNTRYFIDIDIRTKKILNWNFDKRDKLAVQELSSPFHVRIYITRGRYNKLEQKRLEI